MIIREYLTADGVSLYRRWLETLDLSVRARVEVRVLRFEREGAVGRRGQALLGNLGDHKTIGAGVWEARLDFGRGHRLYFGKLGPSTIVLLLGGDKRTQRRDIARAKSA